MTKLRYLTVCQPSWRENATTNPKDFVQSPLGQMIVPEECAVRGEIATEAHSPYRALRDILRAIQARVETLSSQKLLRGGIGAEPAQPKNFEEQFDEISRHLTELKQRLETERNLLSTGEAAACQRALETLKLSDLLLPEVRVMTNPGVMKLDLETGEVFSVWLEITMLHGKSV